MPALSRIEAEVIPSAMTSNVQQSWPFIASDWKLATPCSPMPASFAPSTGCMVAAPAVPAPSAAAASAPTSNPFPYTGPPWSNEHESASFEDGATRFQAGCRVLTSPLNRCPRQVGVDRPGRPEIPTTQAQPAGHLPFAYAAYWAGERIQRQEAPTRTACIVTVVIPSSAVTRIETAVEAVGLPATSTVS